MFNSMMINLMNLFNENIAKAEGCENEIKENAIKSAFDSF